MILALDLGTHFGFAMIMSNYTDKSVVKSGSVKTNDTRYSGGGMRYLKFKQWLTDQHFVHEFKEIYFEEVRAHNGTDAAHVYGGMLATLTAFCEEHSVPYQGVPVGSIKKSASGKGNCGKEVMVRLAQKQGMDSDDDNEADAWHILQMRLKGELPA